MQRVAVELADALGKRDDLDYQQLVLRSAWKWHHIQCAPWLATTAVRLHKMATKKEMDVVLFSSMVTGALATLIRKKCSSANIKLSAIAHGRDVTLPGIYQTLQVRRTLNALDSVLPVSQATATECEKRGMPPSRIRVTPNGVTLSRYTLGTEKEKTGLQLLSVGRLVKRKGFTWFVDQVMPQLPVHVQYKIAGTGPEQDAIQKAAKLRGLEDRVHLLGRASDEDLAILYRESDLLIMPNLPVSGDMEGFGVVMLEAGASGTPAIAAALEGIRDVITNGVNGQLVPSGDVKKFKEAILNYPKTPEMRAQTRTHTATNFSWPNVAELYVRHLHELHASTFTD
ncbi:MAG: glycosyltransferase family 4 protein [Bacteroidetes bacterium]|nr:glycosyltransferase family 4 protein [Bacteroidota bacterium]